MRTIRVMKGSLDMDQNIIIRLALFIRRMGLLVRYNRQFHLVAGCPCGRVNILVGVTGKG